jgi:hypothetical protein
MRVQRSAKPLFLDLEDIFSNVFLMTESSLVDAVTSARGVRDEI